MKHPFRLVIFKSNNYKIDAKKRFMKPHQHSSLELSYVISGEITLDFYSKKTEKLAYMTCVGLSALQHRGEESCGIAIKDGNYLYFPSTVFYHKTRLSA